MKVQLLLAVSSAFSFVAVASSALPTKTDYPENGNGLAIEQCVGHAIDFSRLQSLHTEDLNMLLGIDDPIKSEEAHRKPMYTRSKDSPILVESGSNQVTEPQCIGMRHRLQENIAGIPVHGADILVTLNTCETQDIDYRSYDYDNFLETLVEQAGSSVESIMGKTYSSIKVMDGYTANYTANEARQGIATHLGVDPGTVGEPALEIFISTGGDYLSYRSFVLVESAANSELMEVAVNAHDLSVLSQCTLAGGNSNELSRRQRRYLKAPSSTTSRSLNLGCQSCATAQPDVTLLGTTTECKLSSLYLDNTQRVIQCTEAVYVNDNSHTVLMPGPIPHLHWLGTLNCGRGTTCTPAELPSCQDAISDVQFGGVAAMTFLYDHLGIKGGLNESPNEPVAVQAYAHYQDRYCNAFYSPVSNSLYFGDCDCEKYSPLVALDIVAHELFHGVIRHSSKLVYSGQPGGINEAISDVFGTVLEFYVNDSLNTPDFTIGEQVGAVLRDMEYPSSKSIGSICSHYSGMAVHYASGVMNKAYVRSVRACTAGGCNDERGCAILVGSVFLYASIHGLTRTSNFLDGAEATCSLIDEFFIVRNPASACFPTQSQLKEFIIEGWASVDIVVNGNDCRATSECPVLSPPESPPPTNIPTPQPAPSPTDSPQAEPPTDPPTNPPTAEIEDEAEGEEGCLERIKKTISTGFFWWNK